MHKADFIRFWGWDNLRRWSRDGLRDVAIPDSSKSFLAEVGLPRQGGRMMRFGDDAGQLPRLPGRQSYRRIGFDYVVPICLDEERKGCVMEAGKEFGGLDRYINSGVESFAECLVHYQQYRLKGQATGGDLSDLIVETEQLMRQADPTAFSDEENWWPVVIEQMGYGML
jgi:hypothetical protein